MKIGTIYDISFSTNRADTGALSDADSTPIVRVTENGTNLAYTPTVTSLTTGVYLVSIDASIANGFEVGKRYSVYVTTTVNGIDGANGLDSFTIEARNIDDVLPTASYTAPPTASSIRTEIDTNSTKLDVAVSTRLATAGYAAPPTTANIRTELTPELTLINTNLDAPVSSVGGGGGGGATVADIWTADISTYSGTPGSFANKFEQYGGVSHVIDRSSFDEASKKELEDIKSSMKKISEDIQKSIANIKPPQIVSEGKTTVVKYNDAQQNFIQEFITETIPELADKIDNLIPLLKTYEELILDFEQKEKDYEQLIEELINNK